MARETNPGIKLATLELRAVTIKELADFFAREVVGRREKDVRTFNRMLKEYNRFRGLYSWGIASNQLFRIPRDDSLCPDYSMKIISPGSWRNFMFSVENNKVPVKLETGDEEGVVYKISRDQGEDFYIEGFHLSDSE